MSTHLYRRSHLACRRLIALTTVAAALALAVWLGCSAPSAHALQPASGGPSWWWEYRGVSQFVDQYEDCARCPDGSLVATGVAENQWDQADILIARYTKEGYPAWVERWNGPDDLRDHGMAVTGDRSGNVIVAGRSASTTGGDDIVVLKFSRSGSLRWKAVYDGAAHLNDEAWDVAVDSAGDVIVCGAEGSTKALVIKFRASSGSRMWARGLPAAPGGRAAAYALAVDTSRNVYVTGVRSMPTTLEDAFVARYSRSGSMSWQRYYDGAAHGDDAGTALSLASGPSLYAAGSTRQASGDTDALVLKYSLEGRRAWVRSWGGVDKEHDWANAVACDARGNAIVAGGTTVSGPSMQNGLLIRYTAGGRRSWVRTCYNEENDGYLNFVSLVVSGSGRVWAGGTADAGGKSGMLLARYTSGGRPEWVRLWTGPAQRGASMRDLVSGGGGLLVCGDLYRSPTDRDAVAGVMAK